MRRALPHHFHTVIPAKAGIRKGLNVIQNWIPAFAEMTS
jgi:hypothetical protein